MTTAEATTSPVGRRPWWQHAVRTPWSAALLLLVAYVALSFAMDPMGSLGTDTGGKVATLEVMADRPLGLDADVGYWASDRDEAGEWHGLYYTAEVDGRYVNVTTLPMIELAAPLYRVGGYRLALLLPMAGAIAAAFAARRLVLRFDGAEDRSWTAFWVVGLASPLTIYAVDLWEHTAGVAFVAWGVLALLRIHDPRSGLAFGAAAGLAFGVAFSMRTEALVYGFVAVAVVCSSLLLRRRTAAAITSGAAAVIGLMVAVLANVALEHAAIGGAIRASRATGTAGVGGSDLGLRVKEALVTGAGLLPSTDPADIVVGVVLAGSLLVAVRAATDPRLRRVAVGAAGVAAALYLFRLLEGPGFVPGMLAATPIAAAGLVLLPSERRAREVWTIAVGALPVVWFFQYTGGAAPQWAGRYILPSALLLLALGIAAFQTLPTAASRALIVASVVVTAFGLVWMAERTHEIGRAARDVGAFPEPVVVSGSDFFLRELGAVYQGTSTRWLSGTRAQIPEMVEVADGLQTPSFALLLRGDSDAPAITGFAAVGERTYDWLDIPWTVVTYERTA